MCNAATFLPATPFVFFAAKQVSIDISSSMIITTISYVDLCLLFSRGGNVKNISEIFFFFFKVFVMEMKSENGDLTDGIF